MNESKSRPGPAIKRPATPFAKKALKAMQRAERSPARENARFGMIRIGKET